MAQQILITGGAGVLGSALATTLAARGDLVSTLDVRPWAQAPAGVRHTVGDIRDGALLDRLTAGADAIVHSASALPSYPSGEIRSIVVDGTGSVLAAARRSGVGRVVYISSTSVYGLPTRLPTPEDYPRRPVDRYGAAKVEAELACERYRSAGLCVPVLRPKTFLGPGRLGLFAMLFEWAEDGHHFPVLGSGRALTQMCATDDVVDAILAGLDLPEGTVNDTYNVASAEFGSLRDDFQAVLDAAGHGRRVISIPARPAVAVLRVLADLRLSPVYKRLAHKLLADSYVSIDKARDRLAFQPRYSSREAILAAYGWWREQRTAAPASRATGQASNDRWRQGALALAKVFF